MIVHETSLDETLGSFGEKSDPLVVLMQVQHALFETDVLLHDPYCPTDITDRTTEQLPIQKDYRQVNNTKPSRVEAVSSMSASVRSITDLHQKCEALNCEIELSSVMEFIEHMKVHTDALCQPIPDLADGQLSNDSAYCPVDSTEMTAGLNQEDHNWFDKTDLALDTAVTSISASGIINTEEYRKCEALNCEIEISSVMEFIEHMKVHTDALCQPIPDLTDGRLSNDSAACCPVDSTEMTAGLEQKDHNWFDKTELVTDAAVTSMSASAGGTTNQLQNCDVINCEIMLSTLMGFIEHMEMHVYTLCHPARHLIDGQLTSRSSTYCCMMCGNGYQENVWPALICDYTVCVQCGRLYYRLPPGALPTLHNYVPNIRGMVMETTHDFLLCLPLSLICVFPGGIKAFRDEAVVETLTRKALRGGGMSRGIRGPGSMLKGEETSLGWSYHSTSHRKALAKKGLYCSPRYSRATLEISSWAGCEDDTHAWSDGFNGHDQTFEISVWNESAAQMRTRNNLKAVSHHEATFEISPWDKSIAKSHTRNMYPIFDKSIWDHIPGRHVFKTLERMDHIIFVDLDNWSCFWQRLLQPLPSNVFVWGFYGGSTVWKEPDKYRVEAYEQAMAQGTFYLNPQCSNRQDAADFAICMHVGRMDIRLPTHITFTILSGDKGFIELKRQTVDSLRKVRVVNPHHRCASDIYDELVPVVEM